MASSDVDQKYLARHAALSAQDSQLMSAALFQILGLSTMLARKLVRARRLRRLDTTRDTRSLQLYHHIIWLSREGLSILQTFVTPYTQRSRAKNAELQVLAAKLEASFFHIFCLFHNNPPISQTSIPSAAAAPTPLSPRDGNGSRRRSSTNQPGAKRVETLREPVPSYTSEASYLTNPYAPGAQGAQCPQAARRSPAAPPGLAPIRHPTPTSAFIFPPENFLPYTAIQFENASRLAADLLPGSHPLRLSVAIEHAAFLWDCVKDGDGSRTLARRAIRDCHTSKEGMSDADFEEAAECVGVLGRMMRRDGLGSGGNRDSVRSTRSRDALRSSAVRRSSGASAKASSARRRSAVAADEQQQPTSPGSSQSSPRAVQRPGAGATRSRSGSGEGQKSVQASPTQISSAAAAATSRPGGGGGRERKSSHSTRGSSGSAKSASGGERRSSSERESSALRGSGVTRGARRAAGSTSTRAR